jgi:hypothetical protein
MAYRHTVISSFPKAVLAMSVLGLTFLPMARFSRCLLSRPAAPAAPSLRLHIPSDSLISCQSFQVYHHHPQSRVPLGPLYHIVYLSYYLVQALPWGLDLEQFPLHAGRAVEPHFVTLVVARALGQSVVASFHPVTGQLQVLAGIIVDVM